MNVFVLNCGSSTIKSSLYSGSIVWEGRIEWKNKFDSPSYSIKENGKARTGPVTQKTPFAALEFLLSHLPPIEIAAVGHRIVHGGKTFKESTPVNSEVKKAIRECAELAPLHNLFELEGIEFMEKRFPNAAQIAVFDTAFHHTLPDAARIYPGPYEWVEKGIYRYGFHGISFQYSAKRASEMVGNCQKLLICHLGSGASLCAVKEGNSIDTTMGFTPLDGLMMDTRSGSIDPGILLYLLEKMHMGPEEISKTLYELSGLRGIFGASSDMRDLIQKESEGNFRAKLALEVYLHRLNSLIGSMIASLQGIDALVFTAGIGENAALIRRRVAENFLFLGLRLDLTQNERRHEEDAILSSKESKVKVLLIHTQEAMEIARECLRHL